MINYPVIEGFFLVSLWLFDTAGYRLFGGFMHLTKTEVQILAAVAEGETAPSIARFRFRSADTVRSHIKNIHLKLGVKTNAHAVFVGLKLGFIKLIFCFLMFSQGLSIKPADDGGPSDQKGRVRVARCFSVRVGRVRESSV